MKAQPIVRAYISATVRDRHHSEDLLQRVALTATDKFESYDRDRPFTSWAVGIARNHILDYLRKQSRDKHHFDAEMLDQISNICSDSELIYEPMKEALGHCIEHIKGKNRKILEMRYVSDKKPMKVAKELGMTANAVRHVLHRVRLSLNQCIKERLLGEGGKG